MVEPETAMPERLPPRPTRPAPRPETAAESPMSRAEAANYWPAHDYKPGQFVETPPEASRSC